MKTCFLIIKYIKLLYYTKMKNIYNSDVYALKYDKY